MSREASSAVVAMMAKATVSRAATLALR